MFDKLDAYNLVANLVPGAALIYALRYSGFPTPSPNDLGAFLLVAFVTGVITNRLGSLLIDPLLRWKRLRFLEPKNYKSFVTAEKNDQKLETLVANAGLYRTFFASGLVYLILISSGVLIERFGIEAKTIFVAAVILGMIVSLFALRKEDGYIKARLESKPKKD